LWSAPRSRTARRQNSETTKKLSITLGKAATGETTTKFTADTPKIFARWQGHDFAKGTTLRAVWIAQEVGEVAPPNYKIDEASVTVTEPTSNGLFSLSRPNTGWPIGSYRFEIYSDESLIDTVKFNIAE
jgi:hypothetical protein